MEKKGNLFFHQKRKDNLSYFQIVKNMPVLTKYTYNLMYFLLGRDQIFISCTVNILIMVIIIYILSNA